MDQPRPGAWLEPSLPLYHALARVVDAHQRHTPHPDWEAFATVLERIIKISSHTLLFNRLTDEDEQFLNGVDAALKILTEYNQALSERRSVSVRAAILSLQPALQGRIDVQGKGKSQLFAPGTTEREHQLNRRVEVGVLCQGDR